MTKSEEPTFDEILAMEQEKLEDFVDCTNLGTCLHREDDTSSRWSVYTTEVYCIDGRFLQIVYETGATEYQNPDLNTVASEVYQHAVSKFEYLDKP